MNEKKKCSNILRLKQIMRRKLEMGHEKWVTRDNGRSRDLW